jgi:hypothetical protein
MAYGSGIGAGASLERGNSSVGHIAVTGGTIVARGGAFAAAIGSAWVRNKSLSTVHHFTASQGTFRLTGGRCAPGLGSGAASDYGVSSMKSADLKGGVWTVEGGWDSPGLGAGCAYDHSLSFVECMNVSHGEYKVTGGSIVSQTYVGRSKRGKAAVAAAVGTSSVTATGSSFANLTVVEANITAVGSNCFGGPRPISLLNLNLTWAFVVCQDVTDVCIRGSRVIMKGLVLTADIDGGSLFDVPDLRVSSWPNIVAKYSSISKPENIREFPALHFSNISFPVQGPYELAFRPSSKNETGEVFRVVNVNSSEVLGLLVSLKEPGDFTVKYTVRSATGQLGTNNGTVFHLWNNESFVSLVGSAGRSGLEFSIDVIIWIEACICIGSASALVLYIWLWRRNRKMAPVRAFLVHWLFIN